jgi:hypothetical protein
VTAKIRKHIFKRRKKTRKAVDAKGRRPQCLFFLCFLADDDDDEAGDLERDLLRFERCSSELELPLRRRPRRLECFRSREREREWEDPANEARGSVL